jgi:hypothetical protein
MAEAVLVELIVVAAVAAVRWIGGIGTPRHVSPTS